MFKHLKKLDCLWAKTHVNWRVSSKSEGKIRVGTHRCLCYDVISWPSFSLRTQKRWYIFIHQGILWTQQLMCVISYRSPTAGMTFTPPGGSSFGVPRMFSELGRTESCYFAPQSQKTFRKKLKAFVSLGEFNALHTFRSKLLLLN